MSYYYSCSIYSTNAPARLCPCEAYELLVYEVVLIPVLGSVGLSLLQARESAYCDLYVQVIELLWMQCSKVNVTSKYLVRHAAIQGLIAIEEAFPVSFLHSPL